MIGGYELHGLLGRGATGEVHAASHPMHGDQLAFKQLSEPLAADVARTRDVVHPNVVRVIDTGRDYVVMERITGEDLATRLARLGRLDEATVRTLFAAIADGMDAVHAHDLVHRDLKPANVMLAGDVPKIVDFGIAKYLGERSAVATDRRVGSPAYMAPEQLTSGLVAPCVDVFAFGVMLYEAVTGKLPFSGYADGRCPQLFETAPRVANVSPALARLIARCLEREPGKRPPTMAAIAAELRGAATIDERVTQDVGIADHVVASRKPSRLPFVLAGAAALIAAIAIIAFVWPGGSPSSAAPIAATAPPPPAPTTPTAAPPQPTPAPPQSAPTPAPTTLAVDIRSTPSGAAILIDGKPHGKTPAHLELAGPTAIIVKRAGYRAGRLRAEHAGTFDVQLAPLPHKQDHTHTETLD